MAERLNEPALLLQIIGSGDDVQRLQKRLRCAARALDVNVHFQIQRSDIEAAQRGAQRGPLVLAGDAVLADGLLPVEELQTRLAEWLKKGKVTHAGV